MSAQGMVSILKSTLSAEGLAHYHWKVGETLLNLNDRLGQHIALSFSGEIHCTNCHRTIPKSFQGYCFLCTQKLAACDICMVRPELCHFSKGTCREPEFAVSHCLQKHYLYFANSSGLKVGITRAKNVPYRFMDQGAVEFCLVASASTRHGAGLLEVRMKEALMDKTNWRKMLQGTPTALHWPSILDAQITPMEKIIAQINLQHPEPVLESLTKHEPISIAYPVRQYPSKVFSLDVQKTPKISGKLWGIKGQYLILDSGVLNVRKWVGHHCQVSFE